MTIRLNGEPYDLPGPLTISELLTHLQIDARRVAVELNLQVLKRGTFDTSIVNEGDEVEVVNFVGGGAPKDNSELVKGADGTSRAEPLAG